MDELAFAQEKAKPAAITTHITNKMENDYATGYSFKERDWKNERDRADNAENGLKHLKEDNEWKDIKFKKRVDREEDELKDEIKKLKTDMEKLRALPSPGMPSAPPKPTPSGSSQGPK